MTAPLNPLDFAGFIAHGVQKARPTGGGYEAVTTVITHPAYTIYRLFSHHFQPNSINVDSVFGSRTIVVPGDTFECISFPTPNHHENTQSFILHRSRLGHF